jgi:subtilase family serine protease
MSFAGVRTLCARAAVLTLSAPLLMAGAIPASAATIGHAMMPAVESESQVDFFADFETDATPALPPCTRTVPLACFGADTIRAAYGIQPVLDKGITGAGRTIVIIDAFQNPTLETDVARFDSFWGLPALKLTKYAPFGVPAYDATSKVQLSFSLEIAIDVEWAHATAPDAAIVLVQAKSEKDTDLVNATSYAIRHNLGDVISQSFGEAEMCAGENLIERQHELFQEASERGITLFASSGDKGAARQSCDGNSLVLSVSTPASDPNVTSVGGTHLVASGTGAYQSETAWNTAKGASGGGFSTLYGRPVYQAPFQPNRKARGVPDVAYNADAASGFIVVWMGRGAVVGGTSGGTPQWAGIGALADQAAGHRLGSLNKSLYRIAMNGAHNLAFHDVTTGINTFGGISGYTAGPGWDAVTGLGSPNVANLIRLLSKRDEGQDFGGADKEFRSNGEG